MNSNNETLNPSRDERNVSDGGISASALTELTKRFDGKHTWGPARDAGTYGCTMSAYLSLNKEEKEQPKPEITFNRTPEWMQKTYGLTKQTNIYGLLRTNMEHFGLKASDC